jgi:4-aminobutyrate aminotransferase-like enzyme
MIGIECDRPETAARACSAALSRGIILLPAGDDGAVLSITPPLCIECDALIAALEVLVGCIR